MLDRCRVERVPDPIAQRFAVHLCGSLPGNALCVSAADGVDIFGRLPINAGRPSSPFPSSTPRHRVMNHSADKYSESFLISQYDFC